MLTKQKTTTTRSTITVHVFPHVHKFCKKEFHHASGIFSAEEYSTFGKLVTFALRNQQTRNSNDQARDRLTATITIRLNKRQQELGPRAFKLQRLNIDLDLLFKEYLLVWIHAQAAQGTPAHAACKMFLQHYNLDEQDYSLDNAYKHWQRSQKPHRTQPNKT